MDIQIGKINTLQILRLASNGAYLDDGLEGILLPKRYLQADAKAGEDLDVFIYHDNEGRLIATTDKPLAMVGQVAELTVTDLTQHGVFLNNGIMKEIFVHKTNLLAPARIDDKLWVYVYLDRDNRITGSEFLDKFIKNENVQLTEKELVHLVAYRKTEIGYVMLINKLYLGLLHFNEVFQPIKIAKAYDGFVKRIIVYADGSQPTKIDLAIGKIAYEKVEDETKKILRYLKENNGFLAFTDKTAAEEIVAYFAMSKKTFKMSIGKLYKDRLIIMEEDGLRLVAED